MTTSRGAMAQKILQVHPSNAENYSIYFWLCTCIVQYTLYSSGIFYRETLLKLVSFRIFLSLWWDERVTNLWLRDRNARKKTCQSRMEQMQRAMSGFVGQIYNYICVNKSRTYTVASASTDSVFVLRFVLCSQPTSLKGQCHEKSDTTEALARHLNLINK